MFILQAEFVGIQSSVREQGTQLYCNVFVMVTFNMARHFDTSALVCQSAVLNVEMT